MLQEARPGLALGPAALLALSVASAGGEEVNQLDFVDLIFQQNGKKSIEDRWLEFHNTNPHIGPMLVDKALQLKRSGVKRWGIKNLWEVMRYDYRIRTGGKTYKLNNDYTALYARWVMDCEPELEGFFETRKRTAKGVG